MTRPGGNGAEWSRKLTDNDKRPHTDQRIFAPLIQARLRKLGRDDPDALAKLKMWREEDLTIQIGAFRGFEDIS
jgi:hypothetical protein